ncbi:hypothetical protein V496_04009 [Pseudogymnoascus sp. VKM F-4515 (FW-2607)]|nr:hypothetical protein V496_04009 [Pseudogymnoascus sp. VKM F-4515 (FW-2607)]KFZ00430.1 hypothetical protein V498_00087 [Pseudogymnoascus sp. VKM F-4517 (FW-2822)]
MALSSLFQGSVSALACTPTSFHYPEILGATFLSVETNLVSNYSGFITHFDYGSHQNVNLANVSFYNVMVSYTRLGQNNNIHSQVWLPLDNWNGPHGLTVNLYSPHNFGSVSLNDAAIIGKSITEDFYDQPPTHSYFSGCSGGGRQAMMLAQRYPDAYNGIVADALAVNWPEFFVAMYWPRFLMDKLGVYQHPCKLEIICDQAVAACDGDYGVIDLLITRPELKMWKMSVAAATIAQKAWKGAETADKSPLWYGMDQSTTLTGGAALVNTEYTADGVCTPKTFFLSTEWIKVFILKDPNANLTALNQRDYEIIFRDSVEEYSSFLATNHPDLAEFHRRGEQLLSWHGTSDVLIALGGTTDYYEKVTAVDSRVHDYFRLFIAPGLSHCFGGDGVYPHTAFDAAVKMG